MDDDPLGPLTTPALLLALLVCCQGSIGCTTASSVDPEPVRVISTGHPPVDPPPPIAVTEAIRLALAFAAQKRPDSAEFYVDRVWLEYDRRDRRMWVVSLASPKKFYFFVSVRMNGRAEVPPSGGILSKDPFIEFNYNPPARRPR